MIQITIDERACVACTLCIDECPTGVLAFPEGRSAPVVAKPAECFGCLACAELCPADAIAHEGVTMQQAFYYDPYAVRLSERLGAPIHSPNIPADPTAWARALEDMGVRLVSVASVFEATLGGGLPAVGALAGRTLARHLPRYREARTLEEALAMARAQLAPAWNVKAQHDGNGKLTFEVEECFVREVCSREKLQLGGALCVLFFNYLAGYVGKLGGKRLRLANAQRGQERCTYHVSIHD